MIKISKETAYNTFCGIIFNSKKDQDCSRDIENNRKVFIKKGQAYITQKNMADQGITRYMFPDFVERFCKSHPNVNFERLSDNRGYIVHFDNPIQEQLPTIQEQEEDMSKKNIAKTNEWREKNKKLNAYEHFAKQNNCESVEDYFKKSEQTIAELKQREIEVADLKQKLQKKEEEVSNLNNLLFQYKVQLQNKVESTPLPQVPQPQTIITSVVQEEQEPDPEPLAIFKRYVDELYANQHTKSVILNCSGKIQSVKFKTECKDEYNKYLEVREDVINSLDYKMMDLADAYVNKMYNQNNN